MSKTKPKKAWKPKDGERYCYVNRRGWICISTFLGASFVDKDRIKNGNYFKTETLAEVASDIVRAALKGCEHG
jgi:hypothetical protein